MTYLDNAATSFPKPEQVYVAMDRFARHSLANPGRSGHKMALESEHALANARHRLNRFFNGKNEKMLVISKTDIGGGAYELEVMRMVSSC